jgi:uncharacterized membrane protein
MTTNTTPDRNNTGKTKTLMFYSLFMVGMLIALIPFWQAAAASCIILCFVFLTAYSIRRKETAPSLYRHHAHFIIRTCWISAFISLITLVPVCFWMVSSIDYSAFEICARNLDRTADTIQVFEASKPCVDPFIADNMRALVIATLAAAAPVLIYTYDRIIKGVWFASREDGLPNVKSWF